MKQFLQELMENRGNNYVLPFLWQHGESEAVLREYMGVIEDCGIKAVCLEARPHPDFVGEGWWQDLNIIFDEAQKRNMKIWILDDAHFPTGYAAGKITDAAPELCKQYLMYQCADVCGPMPEATLHVSKMAKTLPNLLAKSGIPDMDEPNVRPFDDDKLISVIASKVLEGNTLDETFMDLTDQVVDGILSLDVPEGLWRIYVFYNTRNGGGRTDYINMLDEASCQVLIDTVYEPHYAHYKELFGTTFAGFFSDEPCVGNVSGYNFDESIGRKRMPLPWNNDMPKLMEERLGKDYFKYLAALWTDFSDKNRTAKVRYAYMDSATRLIAKNFSDQLGAWCKAHQVEYIGHIIEDNNQHSRLGCSQGHFFRAMKGQHMSGIDDIGGQVLLGAEYSNRNRGLGMDGDGEFYHFGLGKLGSSLAHIDPKKEGRAMCEIFGAYGWNTGVRLMKYLTDHFLVRGINYFVPHAFSPKQFPDPDCPPHFYAHGENPQYRHFGKLMKYMNRMCHLLNGGMHIAPVAILYHGEAEWTGGYLLNQKVSRQLLEHQIDFDIVPSDVFSDMKSYQAVFDDKLQINGETYQALIIPYAEFITKSVADFITKAEKKDYPILFVNALPSGICDVLDAGEEALLINAMKDCPVIDLTELASYLNKLKLTDIKVDQEFKCLRYYHYVKEDINLYMFSNESASEIFDGFISVPTTGEVGLYDAMYNCIYQVDKEMDEVGTRLHIHLEPYESIVAVFDRIEEHAIEVPPRIGDITLLSNEWKLSVAESKQYPNFKEIATLDKLHSVGKILPDFSGFMRYEQEFNYDKVLTGKEVLAIQNAYEGVEVWLNDEYIGMRICPPYLFSLGCTLKAGKNTIRIEVANTLYHKVKTMNIPQNSFDFGAIIEEPSGIIGKVEIIS